MRTSQVLTIDKKTSMAILYFNSYLNFLNFLFFTTKKQEFMSIKSLITTFSLILSLFFFSSSKSYAISNTGIVSLTFDDTYKSQYDLAFPLLDSYNWHGQVYINPSMVGKINKMTLSDLTTLNMTGWDVSSHGYSHLDPTTLSSEQLTQHLKDSHDWLINNGFSRGARHYRPPYGACNQTIYDQALLYYDTINIPSQSRFAQWAKFPDSRNYRVIVAHDAIGWDTIKGEIDAASTNDQVLMLVYHNLVELNPTGNQTSTAFLVQTLNYLKEQGKNVLNTSEIQEIIIDEEPEEVSEIIIDNNDAGFSKTGNWGTGTDTSLLLYSTDYFYKRANDGQTASFAPKIAANGTYEVFTWYPKCKVCGTNVPYTIYYNGGSSTVYVNQNDLTNAGTWVSLGTFSLTTSGTKVVISDTASGRVQADAVRFLKTSN